MANRKYDLIRDLARKALMEYFNNKGMYTIVPEEKYEVDLFVLKNNKETAHVVEVEKKEKEKIEIKGHILNLLSTYDNLFYWVFDKQLINAWCVDINEIEDFTVNKEDLEKVVVRYLT